MINVGSVDRTLRLILGIALLAAPFLPQLSMFFASWGIWKYALPVAGVVLMLTAAFRVCPAYMLFGIRTCRTR